MPEIVLALYRAHAGKDAELRALIDRHLPALRAEGLITDRPPVLMRAADGTYIEMFEWVDGGAERAHHTPAVMAVWGPMGEIADFPALKDLPEAAGRFPHFHAL